MAYIFNMRLDAKIDPGTYLPEIDSHTRAHLCRHGRAVVRGEVAPRAPAFRAQCMHANKRQHERRHQSRAKAHAVRREHFKPRAQHEKIQRKHHDM